MQPNDAPLDVGPAAHLFGESPAEKEKNALSRGAVQYREHFDNSFRGDTPSDTVPKGCLYRLSPRLFASRIRTLRAQVDVLPPLTESSNSRWPFVKRIRNSAVFRFSGSLYVVPSCWVHMGIVATKRRIANPLTGHLLLLQ